MLIETANMMIPTLTLHFQAEIPEIPKTQTAGREDPAASLPPAVVGHRTEVDAGTPGRRAISLL